MVYAEPAYPTYAAAADYLHAMPVPVPLRESRKFSIDLDELAAKVTPRTKVLIINSPSNPTGGVFTREDLAAIAELAEKFPRFVILTDEIYSRNIYGDASTRSRSSNICAIARSSSTASRKPTR